MTGHLPGLITLEMQDSYHWVTLLVRLWTTVNSSTPGQYGCRFTDDIFRCIFVNEKFCILSKMSLMFVPKCPVDSNPALVQIMTWHWIGGKPLSEPMLTRTLICGTGGDELTPWALWWGVIGITNSKFKICNFQIYFSHFYLGYCQRMPQDLTDSESALIKPLFISVVNSVP